MSDRGKVPAQVYEHLKMIRARIDDDRWSVGFCMDNASTWYRAEHPVGVRVDRASWDDLVYVCNNVKLIGEDPDERDRG